MNAGVKYYNDDLYSYGNYNSENGEFTFNLVKEFRDFNITYAKAFVFKNMFNSTTNDLFKKLSDGDYEIKFTITKTQYVDSISDYWI